MITAENTVDRLITARVQLLLNNGFFGNLATRLQLQEASDWCPTAATDGRFFYYNTEFTHPLDDDELIFMGLKFYIVFMIIWTDVVTEIRFGT